MSNTKVSDNTEINDVRNPTQFKGFSFSRFKKTEVKTQFVENMKKGKVEPACYWCAELVCAGHYMDVWETILYYFGKHIHLGNPKLAIYLERRFSIFRNIISQGHFLNELQLRNNNNIRNLFAELVCILTLSNKRPSFEQVKINRVEEFDITQMTERLKAPAITYIEPIFKPKDPKELFIAANEFAYNLSPERRNMATAFYWIEWIIEFDNICKKRKEPCYCEKRANYNVDPKLQRDIIWIVWDALFYYCSLLNNPYTESIMKSLLTLFCIKYTTASCKKRRYILYYAVELVIEPVPTNIDIIGDKTIVYTVVNQINNIYKQIKKNEESPNTEYLFSNLDAQSRFEESMQKMEMMNRMMESGEFNK
jgi:hypothetical protein